MPEEKKNNLHDGHRKRVKEQFLKHGLESFTEVQILEALLFYGVPQKDTNETAHRLLNAFGNFKKVFEARYEDLIAIEGVGHNAASLIKFFQMASKKYLELIYTSDNEEISFNTPELLIDYCKGLFLGERKELVYAIALDCDLIIIDKMMINEGEPDSVFVPYRKLTEFVYKCNSSRIVLAHNHPNGSDLPSRSDVYTTKDIVELLDQIEVELVDHIVVGKTGASSMRNSHAAKEIWGLQYEGI